MPGAIDNVMVTLHAMAYDVPVVLRLLAGGRVGPTLIVERIISQPPRDGVHVAVRVSSGEVYHLGEVEYVREVDEHDGPIATPSVPPNKP